MRSYECNILIVPGLTNSGPDHWQTRWQQNLSTARRVEQDDWDEPRKESWTGRLVEAVEIGGKPVVLIAHSLGVVTVAHAAPSFPKGKVRGRSWSLSRISRRTPRSPPSRRPSRRSPAIPCPSHRSWSLAAPTPTAPTAGPRILPMRGVRPSSTPAMPATSTRRAATARGRKA